jgi:glucan biosynthesis protein C
MDGQRYSELDWLRIGLIFAVFLHHVFMPFNGDSWHVMNNDSSKLLDDIMVYFEQLRLQSLFFIAGAGSFLLLQKVRVREFLKSKFHRLFVPLLVGMILIVPPQIYYENIDDYINLTEAYQKLALSFNANHLWFIEFLIVFMVLAIPLNKALLSNAGSAFIHFIEKTVSSKYGLFSFVFILLLIRLSLKYFLPSQQGGLENLSISLFYFYFFAAGMCFIKSHKIWSYIAKYRKINLKIFIVSSLLFYAYYFSPDLSDYASIEVRWQIWWLVCTLVSWSGLLTLVGYASVLCKESPNWLRSTNEFIYPFYILHQSIIVVLAFYIVQWNAGIAVKSISLLLSSLLVCFTIIYLLIKPFNLARYMFGLKERLF